MSTAQASKQLRIGLTGGIGSGKSTAADYFKALGIDVIDADAIARSLTTHDHPNTATILQHFGKAIQTDAGTLDRKALRHLIGTNPEANKWLTDLLHPQIFTMIIAQSAHSDTPYCILMIPLLTESQFDYQLDRIIVIDCPVATQQARAQARDHSEAQAIADIVALQTSRENRLNIADDIITNDQDRAHLRQQVEALHQRYLTLHTP